MSYYPKSQIKTNLYTNGEELAYKNTGEPFKGYYYQISTGKYFSGKNPDDGIPLELTPYNPSIGDIPTAGVFYPSDLTTNPNNSDKLISLVNDVPTRPDGTAYPIQFSTKPYTNIASPRLIPSYSPAIPTNDDYLKGFYIRYFCKKNNELIYIEINQDTFNKLSNNDPLIASELYTPTRITWQLGNESANMNTIKGIEQDLKWYGFSQYFKGNFVS
jgi:hypothetical protein